MKSTNIKSFSKSYVEKGAEKNDTFIRFFLFFFWFWTRGARTGISPSVNTPLPLSIKKIIIFIKLW